MQTPQVLFDDRLLTCSDCHSEFIFTAGEQLFFHDKQFKNDPKRCKPCKSRRSGLAAVANGTGPVAAGISRTETRTECSECGIQTTVPFKPTQGRPVLCRQCFKFKAPRPADVSPALPAELPLAASPLQAVVSPGEEAHAVAVSSLTEASAESTGLKLSHEAATLAAVSMAGAPALSSISTSADLAMILPAEQPAQQAIGIPVELLTEHKYQASSPELHQATVEALKV